MAEKEKKHITKIILKEKKMSANFVGLELHPKLFLNNSKGQYFFNLVMKYLGNKKTSFYCPSFFVLR